MECFAVQLTESHKDASAAATNPKSYYDHNDK